MQKKQHLLPNAAFLYIVAFATVFCYQIPSDALIAGTRASAAAVAAS